MNETYRCGNRIIVTLRDFRSGRYVVRITRGYKETAYYGFRNCIRVLRIISPDDATLEDFLYHFRETGFTINIGQYT